MNSYLIIKITPDKHNRAIPRLIAFAAPADVGFGVGAAVDDKTPP